MNKFKNILLIIMLFVLASCWTSTDDNSQNPNAWTRPEWEQVNWSGEQWFPWNKASWWSEFSIETKLISEFNWDSEIEKIWTISSKETIWVNTQVSWNLSTIYVKQWDVVTKWQLIAKLEDSYNKYYLDLQQAEIDYQKSIISKESWVLSADKQISDAKINMEDALFNYNTAQTTAESELEEAKLNYDNSDLVDTSSQAYLELENAKLGYENTIDSNEQQVYTYISNVSKEYSNLKNSLTDIIKFTDELLWVTDENKSANDDFEKYLWAKNSSSKTSAENSLLDLIDYKKDLLEIDIYSLSEENLLDTMNNFYEWYEKIDTLLGYMETVLDNSISSVGSLSESEISSYSSTVNWYQNTNQWNLSSFNSTKSNITSFLNTYKNNELSLLKNIELQEKQLQDSSASWETTYNKLIASIESNLYTFKSKYEKSKIDYDNVVASKEVTVKSLNNSIASAKNNRDKSSLEYSKLTITSPINWIISSIDTDTNTYVSNGTKLFTIISDTKTEIDVTLNSDEIGNVEIWDEVTVSYLDNVYKGEVFSKSSVANSNLEYGVTILLNTNLELIWGSAVIWFKSTSDSILLPIDYITVEWDNLWTINYLDNGELNTMEVSLWKIDWNSIEILTELPTDLELITTDLSNYNSLSQTLKVNN